MQETSYIFIILVRFKIGKTLIKSESTKSVWIPPVNMTVKVLYKLSEKDNISSKDRINDRVVALALSEDIAMN